jgi:hypothetical protein
MPGRLSTQPTGRIQRTGHPMDNLHSTRTLEESEALVTAYSQSHLGILSGPAIRYELSRLMTPVDILAIDWRKLHEWNDLIGRKPANDAMSQAARVDYAGIDRRHTARRIDLRGQYDGDELVMAVDPGHGLGLLTRLLRELLAMNAALTAVQISAITARTGGLISGFAVAAVLIEGSRTPLLDAARAVAATGVLKAGLQTGARATSGARGTVIGRLPA